MYAGYTSDELYHYGVKGMKWGHRKYNSSLSDRQVRKYAKKSFSEEAYRSNKKASGKVYDKLTGAHKHQGEIAFGNASKSEVVKRATEYKKKKSKKAKKHTGAKVAAKTLRSVGKTSIASAARVYQNQKTYNAIHSALNGDVGNAVYNYNAAKAGYNIGKFVNS